MNRAALLSFLLAALLASGLISACSGGGSGGGGGGSSEPAIPRDGLVGEWLFDGNANDTSDTKYDGTVSGATLTSDRFGQANKAYSFDGSDDYIQIQDGGLLRFNSGNFTVSFWVKYTSAASGLMLWKADSNNSPWTGIMCYVNNPVAGRVLMQLQDAPDEIASIATGCDDNTWHHFIFQREGLQLKLYVDGVLDREVTGSDPVIELSTVAPAANLDILIGSQSTAGGYAFTGSIDEVRMYSRALTDDEIAILYHTNGWKKTKTTWDVAKDFSINENPNGAWSYGWLLTTAMSDFNIFPDIRNTSCWHDSSIAAEPSIWKRIEAGTLVGVEYGNIGMHPGSASQYATVRWTAPASGSYKVNAQFFEGDTSEEEAYVIKNGVQVWHDATTSDNPSYSYTFSLVAGDTIDFAIGGILNYGTTPVTITITRE